MNILSISKKFSTQAKCVSYLEKQRWGKKPVCPYCGSENVVRIKTELRYHCNAKECKRSFSVFVGTIFENCRLPMPTYFVLIKLMLAARKGISSMQLARDLGITVKTSWYAAMRVRCAMVETITDLSGTVEADEAYIGGKPRKKNKVISDSTAYLSQVQIEKPKRGRGTKKIPVAGFVERDGRVVTKMLEHLTTRNLLSMLHRYVNEDRAKMVTDDFKSYKAFDEHINREVIKHSQKEFVRGDVHTNTIEGFWSIVKNGLRGQYHVLSKKYLPFYLAEFAYKYNRRNSDESTFDAFMKDSIGEGKCLVYHKPVTDVKKIAYPRKNIPAKADVKKFQKDNKEAGKKRRENKINKNLKKYQPLTHKSNEKRRKR